ncbi:MAG: porin family protein [Fibrobacter sp.]|nr:porin family protein [Fibrobacter sp.]
MEGTTRKALPRLVRFIVCFILLCPTGLQAQVRFGLKGGLEMATLDFDSGLLDSSNRMGFFAGPTLKIGIPLLPGLSVDVAALYNQRDLKVQEEDFTQKSLVAQGDARIGVGLGEFLNVFILAGPQFSFNVGDDIIHWFDKDGNLREFSLQETMLSVNFGGGVTFAKHFEGSIRYNVPIGKTADFTWQDLGDQIVDQMWKHTRTHTNSWNIALTYYF